MGRLGPLTSQALGRSPYDDVVYGDGEGDDRAPLQMYDERGRPVNPETKRINKDVIRSHNEVMLVIGVAEPEDSALAEAQADSGMKFVRSEERVGRVLLNVGRVLELGGVWGVNGLRQRILIYREYARVPFFQLYKYERLHRSGQTYFLDGLPSFLAAFALKQLPFSFPRIQKSLLAQFALTYVRIHLQLFAFMQRVELSPSPWLPELQYFIPFSKSSPIPAPPPLTSHSAQSVLGWLGGAALNAAPFLTFWLFNRMATSITKSVWERIGDWVPSPTNEDGYLTKLHEHTVDAPAPTSAPDAGNEQPRNGRDITRDEAALRALEGHPQPEAVPPLGAVRRQSTVLTRDDAYGSEDEEGEIVSATLISFDVEAAESSETPPGVWSAELRPNVGGDRSQPSDGPIYRENTLTELPSIIATDILAVVTSYILTAPIDAFALRLMARTFRLRRGLPMGDLYGLSLLDNLSWTAVTNLVGVEMLHLCIGGDLWAIMTLLSHYYRVPKEVWDKIQENGSNPRAQNEE